jgi:phosphate transport system substrate-binding protein
MHPASRHAPDRTRAKLRRVAAWLAAALLLSVCGTSCKKKSDSAADAGAKESIQNIGSDTMVNLAQAWAEEYANVVPNISVEVSGGGSGVGIAALINRTADIANASRHLEPEEEEKAKSGIGRKPVQFIVGYDGLAIYVHRDNPLQEISLEELAEIYREDGKLERWSQLGVKHIPGAKNDDIIRISRQNNSGTYAYFRETVVGKKADFKLGSLDMNGSKDVVEQVGKTPGSLGYSGLGYATAAVKVLKVSRKKGGPSIMPSNATVGDKTYPISRPMFMFTPGEPPERVKKYIEWVLSEQGQAIVKLTGYVPLTQ